MNEYEKLKSDDSYYFLLTTKGQFKKETEPGITFLTLVKGGQNATTGIDEMIEIVSFPFSSVNDPSGREYVFLQPILEIIQNYALAAMEKDIDAYTGLPNFSMNIAKSGHMTLVFSDFILAWHRFVEPVPYRQYLVLVSYFLAQWLLFVRSTPYRIASLRPFRF